MFEQIGTVIIVIVVLVVGAGLGLFAGFVLGRHKGQEMARGVKSEELEEAKTSLENARFENAELSARNAAAQAQIEGVNQQLAFAKSQLAQAQQAEQIRIQQERERAAAEAERKRQADAQAAEVKRAEQEARLKEQSKVLEALAPVAKNLDTLQNKVTQIEEGRKREMGALGAQLKGLNDQQLDQFLAWIRHKPIELRFIELMQTGEMDNLFRDHHTSGELIKEQLLGNGWIQQLRAVDDGPAQVFMHPESQGGVGLIMPYSKDFCAGCNRLRVSSVGKLHLCLFGDNGVELRDLLTADDQQEALQWRIRQALTGKAATHRLHDGNAGMTPHLASIGG